MDARGTMTIGQAIDEVAKALSSFEATDQQTILMAVCSHLKIPPPATIAAPLAQASTPLAPILPEQRPEAPAGIDIRTLKEQKKPATAKQMACIVAHYLAELAPEEERKQIVTAADLDKYFKQANFKLPEAHQQILPDAKKSGYFDSGSRGEYKLNRVGRNLVTHGLPPAEKG